MHLLILFHLPNIQTICLLRRSFWNCILSKIWPVFNKLNDVYFWKYNFIEIIFMITMGKNPVSMKYTKLLMIFSQYSDSNKRYLFLVHWKVILFYIISFCFSPEMVIINWHECFLFVMKSMKMCNFQLRVNLYVVRYNYKMSFVYCISSMASSFSIVSASNSAGISSFLSSGFS